MGICTCIKSSPSSTQSNIILSQCASQRDFGPKKLDTTLIATNIKFSTPPIAPFEIALLNEINSVRTNPKEYANRFRELIDKFFAVSYTYNFNKKFLSVSTICS